MKIYVFLILVLQIFGVIGWVKLLSIGHVTTWAERKRIFLYSFFYTFLMILCVRGCVESIPTAEEREYLNKVSLVEECKKAIKRQLENANSVKFRNVYWVRSKIDWKPTICGEINLHNSSDEDSEYERFYYGEGYGVVIFENKHPDHFDDVYRNMCGGDNKIPMENSFKN